jgi:hypothetical protein
MTETETPIKLAYNGGTITAAVYHEAPNPVSDPVTFDATMIGVDVVAGSVTDDLEMFEPEDEPMQVGFWLTPEEATKLAYRLLTLAYQAGEEIAE